MKFEERSHSTEVRKERSEAMPQKKSNPFFLVLTSWKEKEYSALALAPAPLSDLLLRKWMDSLSTSFWIIGTEETAANYISFTDDEIPPEGTGHRKAIHISARCKGCTISRILVDNGSSFHLMPKSTLNQMLKIRISDQALWLCEPLMEL